MKIPHIIDSYLFLLRIVGYLDLSIWSVEECQKFYLNNILWIIFWSDDPVWDGEGCSSDNHKMQKFWSQIAIWEPWLLLYSFNQTQLKQLNLSMVL